MDAITRDATQKMEKSLEALKNQFGKLRTGRASLNLLDDIRVDYYGQMVPLNQVATLGIPEPRLITIAPWEASIIPAIEKAIDKANIGLNPVSDGKLIRLPIPALSEERRKDLVKSLKGHGEDARVSVRHARRDAMDLVKKQEKDSALTEDDAKKAGTIIQKLTDDFIAKIDAMVQTKEKEIMQV
ncbi:ribosome recycling factor [bacterium]|nr:ribosome recycling factor [bacterium]